MLLAVVYIVHVMLMFLQDALLEKVEKLQVDNDLLTQEKVCIVYHTCTF